MLRLLVLVVVSQNNYDSFSMVANEIFPRVVSRSVSWSRCTLWTAHAMVTDRFPSAWYVSSDVVEPLVLQTAS